MQQNKTELQGRPLKQRENISRLTNTPIFFYLKGFGTVLMEAPKAAARETFPTVWEYRAMRNCLSITEPPKMSKSFLIRGGGGTASYK